MSVYKFKPKIECVENFNTKYNIYEKFDDETRWIIFMKILEAVNNEHNSKNYKFFQKKT